MRARSRWIFWQRAILSLVVITTGGCADGEPSPAADERPWIAPSRSAVVDWNRSILEAAEEEDGFLTLKGVRTATLVHLTMAKAMERTMTAEGREILGGDGAAAAARAAYTVAVDQYPDREPRWRGLRDRWLEAVPVGEVEDAREIGEELARQVLASRESDRWDSEAEYQWQPMAPGVYAEFDEHSGTPEGFVFGAGWARAQPFVLESPDQFRAPPPPAIDSAEYTEAFREVKAVGATRSETRTEDQAHLAMWWKEFVESSHNRLARELILEEELDPVEANRFLGRLNAAVFDAYLSVFDNKFHYNHWRPYTAIRWAAHDGNPETEADEDWDNLHRHTYAFPSYPSAHGTACAAAMTVFADTFGERPVEITIPEVDSAGPMSEKVSMDPATRSFASFSEAAQECSLSRMYLGIHFRYDSEEGTELGRKVGRAVVTTAFEAL